MRTIVIDTFFFFFILMILSILIEDLHPDNYPGVEAVAEVHQGTQNIIYYKHLIFIWIFLKILIEKIFQLNIFSFLVHRSVYRLSFINYTFLWVSPYLLLSIGLPWLC